MELFINEKIWNGPDFDTFSTCSLMPLNFVFFSGRYHCLFVRRLLVYNITEAETCIDAPRSGHDAVNSLKPEFETHKPLPEVFSQLKLFTMVAWRALVSMSRAGPID